MSDEAIPSRRRKWWAAALLTVLLPGLGQVYNGQVKKGLLFFCIIWLWFVVLWATAGLAFAPFNIIIPVLVFLSAYIYILRDAIIIARRIGELYQLKIYNKWYLYLLAIVISALIQSPVIKHTLIEAYKIPAGSMQPTLLVGDYILADKLTYRFKNPNQGDIIIFKFPGNLKQNYIKRLIATEGQVVEIRNKKVYVDGKLGVEPPNSKYTDQTASTIGNPNRDNFGPYRVPKGHLFVMGDNRDNSYDSRFWGPLDRRLVLGKAKTIHWSWDSKTHSVRWNRIGQVVK